MAFDLFQLLTLLFGGLVLLNVALVYNNNSVNQKLAAVIHVLIVGIPYAYVAYALLTRSEVQGMKSTYAKYIVNGVAITAFAFIVAKPLSVIAVTSGANSTINEAAGSCSTDKWCTVTKRVLAPLAYASLFALPIANL